jgi:glycogen operon protein
MRIWPGAPYPLGATWDGWGTNFALFSEVAERVELCLFLAGDEMRIDLTEVDGFAWHGYVPEIGPGTRYGYRVHGRWDPVEGFLCNPAKLLLDPYAKAMQGAVSADDAVFGYDRAFSRYRPSATDSAPYTMKSVVINPFFDWGADKTPQIAYHETVIYEAHVRGLTLRHPQVPLAQQGTYAGLAHPAVIDHVQRLGITAIELMPVHQFVSEPALVARGLTNYWGYNTIGYFAPHNGYSSAGDLGEQVGDFKAMVRSLHRAGIEVILDVVYNHTAEGGHGGPTLAFRGIDNGAYYRLRDDDPRYNVDYSGCGNSLQMRHPHVLELVMDSLRYWVLEMHVDGFRFDLASALARELHEVDRLSAFFDMIQQDPVVSQVKLIAEPWDVGEGGYQVGNFPPLWTEWNAKYRDTTRDFWRGQHATLGEFASRLTGSSDLYMSTGRRPVASINFVTCHDGFTLRDLVSYDRKHNEANGEDGRDGSDDNRSWNCGVEGPTDDQGVAKLRSRQQRNFLATLLLSQGVPMLLAGDELGRGQQGNNNPYCQDNEVSWVNWDEADNNLLRFVRVLTELRRAHPVFRRRRFFWGTAPRRHKKQDIAWFTPSGQHMTDDDWDAGHTEAIAVYLNGDAITEPDAHGQRLVDDSFLLLFNASSDRVSFGMPVPPYHGPWEIVLDTTTARRSGAVVTTRPVRVGSYSLCLLRQVRLWSGRWIIDVTTPFGHCQLAPGCLARPGGEDRYAQRETGNAAAGNCIVDDHVIFASVNDQPTSADASDRFTYGRLGHQVPDADPAIVAQRRHQAVSTHVNVPGESCCGQALHVREIFPAKYPDDAVITCNSQRPRRVTDRDTRHGNAQMADADCLGAICELPQGQLADLGTEARDTGPCARGDHDRARHRDQRAITVQGLTVLIDNEASCGIAEYPAPA